MTIKRVYIAGPITLGDQFRNCGKAMEAFHVLRDKGFAPFCPHTSGLLQMIQERTWEDWLDYDEEWIKVCHAVLRLPGESRGADRECAFAEEIGIPIFHSIEALEAQANNALLEAPEK